MRKKRQPVVRWKRSLVKAAGYRVMVLVKDLVTVYLFKKRVDMAVGSMTISNIHATATYYTYERTWTRAAWGNA